MYMKTVRKRKVCKLNGMKYDPELRCVIAQHSDGGENYFHLSKYKSHSQRNEEFKKAIKLAKEMRED